MAQYDTVCKFLIENFPTDFATWLLGEPIQLSTLSPSELSVEPIRADALMLLQSSEVVLHVEFQTRPKPDIPFRMLDYRVRCHRRYPNKQMRQVVIYLQRTTSVLTRQTTFNLENTHHSFEVIRLWEQPIDPFLSEPGLLPFAVLSREPDKESVLRQVADRIQQLPEQRRKTSISTITEIIAGLELDKDTIERIMSSSIWSESSVYKAIIEKGIDQGRAEGIDQGRAEALKDERRLISKMLTRKVGSLSDEQSQKIGRLTQEQLEALGEALFDFSDSTDLTAWLQRNES